MKHMIQFDDLHRSYLIDWIMILLNKLTITFPTLSISRASYFFTKTLIWFLDFIIQIEFSLCFGMEKWVFHQFGFYNLNTPKNWVRSLLFSDYRIWAPPKNPCLGKKQFGLYNLNYINTNFENVCIMNS